MKKNPVSPTEMTEPNELDFDEELALAKEVFMPDVGLAPDEPTIAFGLRCAFMNAGYKVRRVEDVGAPAVLIIRAIRKDARRIANRRLFHTHIRHILSQAGFKIKQGELIIDQTGDRVLVSFLWQNSPAQYNEAMPVLEGEFDPIP